MADLVVQLFILGIKESTILKIKVNHINPQQKSKLFLMPKTFSPPYVYYVTNNQNQINYYMN